VGFRFFDVPLAVRWSFEHRSIGHLIVPIAFRSGAARRQGHTLTIDR
jgi:hypothetical protein